MIQVQCVYCEVDTEWLNIVLEGSIANKGNMAYVACR